MKIQKKKQSEKRKSIFMDTETSSRKNNCQEIKKKRTKQNKDDQWMTNFEMIIKWQNK